MRERHILMVLLAASIAYQSAALASSPLRYPDAVWNFIVSEGQQLPITITATPAIGGDPPITYRIAGVANSSLFAIDSTSGIIQVTAPLDREVQESYVINKSATDRKGRIARQRIKVKVTDVNDNPPQCTINHRDFIVRETAPPGEVVGNMECSDPDIGENAESVYSLDSRISNDGTIPFKATEHGNIVVSAPLSYRASVYGDIYMLNVRVRNKLDIVTTPGQNSSNTEANMTVNITIEKAACPTNWTYDARRHEVLAVPGLKTVYSASEEQCMTECSSQQSWPCNGFVFDLVHLSCDLQNETVYTQPDALRHDAGYWLYRKFCHVEPLPMPGLRELQTNLRNVTGQGGYLQLHVALEKATTLLALLTTSSDTVYTDIWVAAELLRSLLNTTRFHTATLADVTAFAQVAASLISKLLDPSYTEMWNSTRMAGHDTSRLLDTFDILSDKLLHGSHGNINVSANFTSIYAMDVNVTQSTIATDVTIDVSSDGKSSIALPTSIPENISSVRMVVGVISGLENVVTFEAPVRDGNHDRKLLLSGHVVSVVITPYMDSMFSTSLKLDINSPSVNGTVQSRQCVFLEKGVNRDTAWKSDGCQVTASNHTHTRCQCNHLTNFAVLVQIEEYELTEAEETSLEVLTIIGCCLSIAALTATIVILVWLRLQSERFVLLMNLSVAIVMAQVVFLAGIDAVNNVLLCRLVAILLHYLYLCVFTLMLAEGLQLYNKLHRALKRELNFTMYLVLGWGVPCAIVAISLATDVTGYGTPQHCWLSTRRGTIWAFVGPALTVISMNLVVLVMVIRTFLGVRINARKTDREKFKSSVKASVVMLPLLGVTWLFGVVAINAETVVFQYIFAILNSLQGMFIFLFHVVFNDEVRRTCRRTRRKITEMSETSRPYVLD